ncbi:MAG: TonB-dependent receptor, partial [Balneolaceae bacterium]
MISKKTFLVSSLLFLTLPVIQAQDVTLRGVISDRQSASPLEAANIILQRIPDGKIEGTTTDINGLFEFNRLQRAEYIFLVRYIGYKTYSDTLDLRESRYNSINVVMIISEEKEEVTVTERRLEDLDPGQTRIQGIDLRRVPTPGGSGDLASFLQSQPGVVAAGDRGGQLFIRGGTPSENLVLVDGATVYQPFHIIGFFSLFPEDVVSKVDLYAGGFGARYSGRTSSVMDVRLKNGNLYNRNWSASLSPFISELFFETPIKEGESSLMVSARGSLIESTSKLYPERQPLRFNSQLIKYSNSSNQGVNCSIHALRTYDRGKLNYKSGDFFSWTNVVTAGRCSGVSEDSNISFADVNFGVSYFSNEIGSLNLRGSSSSVIKSHIDLNMVQSIGEWRLDYGIFTNLENVNHDISGRFVSMQSDRQLFMSSGGYAELDIPVGENFSIEPGISLTTYLRKFKSSFEPRLRLSWQPRGKIGEELHVATGIYYQPLIGVSDFRDIGTAFTAWMPMPDTNRKLTSKHAIAGWRQPLGRFLKFSAEGYYKEMSNIPVSVWSSVAQFSTDLAYANGEVFGADVRLEFNHRQFYAILGYGYSWMEYETAQDHFGIWFGEPVQSYHPPHD